MGHVSGVTCQVSDVMCQMPCVMCHFSHVMCRVSHVTCQRQQPQPETLPLLTPPLCTVGWFAKTQKPKLNSKTQKIIDMAKTQKHIEVCQY